MRRYVRDVREAGAKPILVTPLTRRMFRDGKLEDTLGPWADATRKIAEEESVPLLDLYRDSSAAVQKMGPVEANTLRHDAASPGIRRECQNRNFQASSPEEAEPRPDRNPRVIPDQSSTTRTWARRVRPTSAAWSRWNCRKSVPTIQPYIKQQ